MTTDSPKSKQPGARFWTLTGCGCGLLGVFGVLLVFLLLGV